MKKRILAISVIAAVLMATVVLAACFSPLSGENGEGMLTVSFGGTPGGRFAVDPAAELANMDITVTLNGPGGTQTQTVRGGGVMNFKVIPGAYTITAQAVGDSAAAGYSTIFPSRMLRAYVEQGITVGSGAASVALTLYTATEAATGAQLNEAIANARTDGKREYVFVSGPISFGSTAINVSAGQDICLSARPGTTQTITRAATTAFFNVAGGQLTLGNATRPHDILTLDGNKQVFTTNTTPLISINSGTLTLHDGAQLVNNLINSGNGGAVMMSSGAFNMDGGQISNNKAGYGGGVYMAGGIFTMLTRAVISDNISSAQGSGVYMSGGTFNMNGGSILRNTSENQSYCVVVDPGTQFNMSGGEIAYNRDNGYGIPSVVVAGGTFIMSGGSIHDNYGMDGITVADSITVLSGNAFYGNGTLITSDPNFPNGPFYGH